MPFDGIFIGNAARNLFYCFRKLHISAVSDFSGLILGRPHGIVSLFSVEWILFLFCYVRFRHGLLGADLYYPSQRERASLKVSPGVCDSCDFIVLFSPYSWIK